MSPHRRTHGFSAVALEKVEQNYQLANLVALANSKLFNLSNSVQVEMVKSHEIEPVDKNGVNSHVYWSSFDSGDDKVPFITHEHFHEQVFMSLGLPQLNLQERTHLSTLLAEIGALARLKASNAEVIRFDVLSQAWLVHGYEFSSHRKLKKVSGLNFNMLSAKSIRIMNRMVNVVAAYTRLYQAKKMK